MASCLQPHEPTSAGFRLPFSASSPSSAFTELKRIRALLWVILWVRGLLCGWFDFLSRWASFLPAVRLSYHLCVHPSTVTCLQELFFAFTVWPRGLAFGLSQLLTCFPHEARAFLAFDFKWKTCDSLSLSLEHLETTVKFLISLISILLCLREKGGPRKERDRGRLVGRAGRTHTFIDKLPCPRWTGFVAAPKTRLQE